MRGRYRRTSLPLRAPRWKWWMAGRLSRFISINQTTRTKSMEIPTYLLPTSGSLSAGRTYCNSLHCRDAGSKTNDSESRHKVLTRVSPTHLVSRPCDVTIIIKPSSGEIIVGLYERSPQVDPSKDQQPAPYQRALTLTLGTYVLILPFVPSIIV
ncbi:hypothetical protein F4809DRAFT_339960 [Biscogniauxia mediterranea]|nr:hypothetical protein F4809DRAFT_339960 [Biscogniauxia mediterranea]